MQMEKRVTEKEVLKFLEEIKALVSIHKITGDSYIIVKGKKLEIPDVRRIYNLRNVLTNRQKESFNYVVFQRHTATESAQKMGTQQSNVSRDVKEACRRIMEQFLGE